MMPGMAEVYDALRAADAAGDTVAARRLAEYIQSQKAEGEVKPPAEPALPKETPEPTPGEKLPVPKIPGFGPAEAYGKQLLTSFLDPAGAAKNLSRAAAEGLTVQLSTPVEALGRSLANGSSWEDEMQKIRDQQEAYAKINPGVQGAVNFLGGMVTGGAEAKALSKVPGFLHTVGPKEGEMTWKGIMSVLGLGGAEGAIAGTALAPKGQRDVGALVGAGLGMAAPAIMMPLGAAIGGGYRWLADKLASSETAAQKTSRLAEEVLGQDMIESRTLPGAARQKAAELGPGATPADAMGDLGPAILHQVSKESPEAAAALKGGLLASERTAPAKLAKEVKLASRLPKAPVVQRMEKAVGFDVPEARAARENLVKLRRENAAEDYAFLKGETVKFSPEEVKWLSLNQQALKDAREIAAARNDMEAYDALGEFLPKKAKGGATLEGELDAPIAGEAFPAPENIGADGSVEVPAAAAAKMASSMKKIGRGHVTDLSGALDEKGSAFVALGDEISNIISRSHPASYGKAQARYAANSRLISAFDVGKDAVKTSPADLARAMEGMTPKERQAVQLGYLEAYSTKSGNAAPDANGVFSFLRKGNETEKQGIIFGAKKAAGLQKIADEAEAASLLNASSQGGGASLKSFLTKPGNRDTLLGVLGEQRLNRLESLADRNLTFANTEIAAASGAKLGAQNQASKLKSNKKSMWERIFKGSHYYNPNAAKYQVTGSLVDYLSSGKEYSPEVLAKISEILSSSRDPQQAILRISNADINRATRERIINLLSSQRRTGASLGAAKTLPAILGGQ